MYKYSKITNHCLSLREEQDFIQDMQNWKNIIQRYYLQKSLATWNKFSQNMLKQIPYLVWSQFNKNVTFQLSCYWKQSNTIHISFFQNRGTVQGNWRPLLSLLWYLNNSYIQIKLDHFSRLKILSLRFLRVFYSSYHGSHNSL